MIYNEIIAGSRAYGLEIEGSDIDLCRVAEEWNIGGYEGEYNLIQVPRDEFIKRAFLTYLQPYYIQWWFPLLFRTQNEIARYIKENREHFVESNSRLVYKRLHDFSDRLYVHADQIYQGYPKRMAYSTLFYAILTRYAEGRSFADAFHLDGEIQQQLLAMRRREVPLEEAIALNRAYKDKADAVFDFYDRDPDMEYIYGLRDTLCDLLGIEPIDIG